MQIGQGVPQIESPPQLIVPLLEETLLHGEAKKHNVETSSNAEAEMRALTHGTCVVVEEPTIIQNALYIKDFSNSIDLARIDQVLKDEGLDLNVLNPKWDFLTLSVSKLGFSRNPYADFNSKFVPHPSKFILPPHQN
ncbi:uncharacterized protein E5676_scaffold811G00760 [Cucumis melo var. makuwa]|uniref:Uncharacterized protein n=1 Tax=Cucumis melo var. makuwa TaxID=1194695 RepID=A0A5D3D8K8_CUCMM|nr:uncharacterized protein E5676_scaffold811G00760 [Cucumis melo var. makuwa]